MSRPLAVVTGTSSGIGKAIARELLESGWSVVGISRRAAEPVSELASAQYHHIALDLTDTERLAQTIPDIIRVNKKQYFDSY